MFYVYEWYIKETGEIIYVGKGCKNRYKVRKHNRLFNEMIKRYDCESRIVKRFDSEKEAFEYEFERVFQLKCIGQCVCNINKGGAGGVTNWWTDEKREQYSKNNVMKSKEQRKRMILNNPMKDKKTSERVSLKKSRGVIIGEDKFNSIKSAQEHFGVSYDTIKKWCKKGISSNFYSKNKTTYMSRLKKLKKIRIHREGTHTLAGSLLLLLVVNSALYFGLECKLPFYIVAVVSIVLYGMLVNFFRCPIRLFGQEDTEKIVVAPADGRIVVIEEVDENEYFHDRRLMISIFMSVINVHANWYPVDGTVKKVAHHNGKFMKAWLPKASTDNERSTVVIETPEGVEVMARQIAGAMARRIVTYAEPGEDCYIDEHMGFIKFGSRVDVYLPLGTEVLVKMGQTTTGNQTVIAKLK